jgi:hypothetical protein
VRIEGGGAVGGGAVGGGAEGGAVGGAGVGGEEAEESNLSPERIAALRLQLQLLSKVG